MVTTSPYHPPTPLKHASQRGDVEAVQAALDANPPPTQAERLSAALDAACGPHVEVFKLLLQNGVSVVDGVMVPSALKSSNPTAILQLMYDHGWDKSHINRTMSYILPMQGLAERPHPALYWLLDHGMDPNLPANRGMWQIRGKLTPMNAFAYQSISSPNPAPTIRHMEALVARGAVVTGEVLENAVSWKDGKHNPTVLQWLIDHGADVNQTRPAGASLLCAAVRKKSLPLVQILLANGADTSPIDPVGGKTALEMAQEMDLEEIVDALRGAR